MPPSPAGPNPAYDFLGSIVLYAPDLGKFTADCDANGTPLLGQTELRRAILEAPAAATREELVAAVDSAAGDPWLTASSSSRSAWADRAARLPRVRVAAGPSDSCG